MSNIATSNPKDHLIFDEFLEQIIPPDKCKMLSKFREFEDFGSISSSINISRRGEELFEKHFLCSLSALKQFLDHNHDRKHSFERVTPD